MSRESATARGLVFLALATLVVLSGGCKGSAERSNCREGECLGGRYTRPPEATILRGTTDHTDLYPEVVFVNSTCSGTLVSPTLVVTAAHCVCPTLDGVPLRRRPSDCDTVAEVRFQKHGAKTDKVSATVAVHPSFYMDEAPYGDDGFSINDSRADVATLRFDAPLTLAAPVPLSTSAPLPGAVVQLVGFGKASCEEGDESDRVRRVGENRLDGVTPDLLEISNDDETQGTLTDKGDSGGALLAGEAGRRALAGVTSYGWCGSAARYTNVATYRQWILSTDWPTRDAGVAQDAGPVPTPDAGPRDAGLPNCAQLAMCATCTPVVGCGWCATTSTCTPGTASGPASGACADWDWLPDHCGGGISDGGVSDGGVRDGGIRDGGSCLNGASCGSPRGGICNSSGVCVCPSGQSACDGDVCLAVGGACTSAGSGGCAQVGMFRCSGTQVVCDVRPKPAGAQCTDPSGGVCNTAGACTCPSGQTECSGTCRAVGSSCTSGGSPGCQRGGTLVCSGTGTTCNASPRTSGICTGTPLYTCNSSGNCVAARVELCTGKGYSACTSIYASDSNLGPEGLGDKVSSVRLVNVRSVTLYEHDSYAGKYVTLTSSCSDLEVCGRNASGWTVHDQASSIRVTP